MVAGSNPVALADDNLAPSVVQRDADRRDPVRNVLPGGRVAATGFSVFDFISEPFSVQTGAIRNYGGAG